MNMVKAGINYKKGNRKIPTGNLQLGRPRLRRENCVIRNVKKR